MVYLYWSLNDVPVFQLEKVLQQGDISEVSEPYLTKDDKVSAQQCWVDSWMEYLLWHFYYTYIYIYICDAACQNQAFVASWQFHIIIDSIRGDEEL